MSATTMPAVSMAEKAGWATRALAIIIDPIGVGISCVVFFIGVIWTAFDAQKQGWHDKIAGTYVVKA